MTALAGEGDPPTALFTFFTEMVAQAAGKKSVIGLQARTGTEIQVTQSAEGSSGVVTPGGMPGEPSWHGLCFAPPPR